MKKAGETCQTAGPGLSFPALPLFSALYDQIFQYFNAPQKCTGWLAPPGDQALHTSAKNRL